MADDTQHLSEKDLHQWDLLARFRQRLLAPARPARLHPSWRDPKRHAQHADYLSLFLFGLLHPALKTRRALGAASPWERVRREVCTHSLSLGSFSEAQHLVEPAALEQLFGELAAQVHGPPPAEPRAAWQQWFARDSSLFAALPRMSWALYGGGRAGAKNNAVRLHLSLHLLDDKPAQARITPGKTCERKAWKAGWEKGAAYVGDRNFAQDYRLLGQLDGHGCRYVLRLREEAVVTVEAELPVSAADREARVIPPGVGAAGRARGQPERTGAGGVDRDRAKGDPDPGDQRGAGATERAGSGAALPAAVADRMFFPLDQMPARLPALAGGKRGRSDAPALLGADRLGAAATGHGPATEQEDARTDPDVSTGLGQSGGTAGGPGAGRSGRGAAQKKQVRSQRTPRRGGSEGAAVYLRKTRPELTTTLRS